jgi:trehalose utilization protein|tara:strand:+ start:410 stop:1072 length:663 start_codon:yes stop_codon:yes gene_type:complete
MKITIWNEFIQEKTDEPVAAVYPDGIHNVIADYLRSEGLDVRTATLNEPQHGLSEATLSETDVLVWWGHKAHREVDDKIVDKIQDRILNGMGLVILHSAHYSKIFKRMMGTSCDLGIVRDDGKRERVWVIEPNHPICRGLNKYFDIPNTEVYGERFDVPDPDTLVLLSSFEGGEVFRTGCCYRRGLGKIFYFRPGHETYPIFYQPEVQQIIKNSILWAAS